MVREKSFREDLFYRINVIPIRMPPLRDKPEDIPALAEHFLEKYRALVGKPIERDLEGRDGVPGGSTHWPGNVRQLENVVERAVALESTDDVQPESLPRRGPQRAAPRDPSRRSFCPRAGSTSSSTWRSCAAGTWPRRMERSTGVQTRAAELLGMTFRSFRYFAKKYDLSPRDSASAEREVEDPALAAEPS